jgi:ABC-type sugar transport system ATPase subunit
MASSIRTAALSAHAGTPGAAELLQVIGLTKSFSGMPVLKNVNFSLCRGEVLTLVGENGAGKSTLKNTLSGLLAPDAGEIRFLGASYAAFSADDADRLGIGTIHQELSLFANLSVAENIHMPHLPHRGGIVDWQRMRTTAAALLAETLGAHIDPAADVESLSLGERQLVEIAKAIHRSSSLLILDEPTTCLSVPERRRLFDVVRRLKSNGFGIIYITHFLEEVYELADRIVVLRDGAISASGPASAISPGSLTRAMVGGELIDMAISPAPLAPDAQIALSVSGVTDVALVRDVTFNLRAGEILGIAGLMGAGRSELAEILVGLREGTGTVVLLGLPFERRSPRLALARGLVLVSEDRRKDQAFLGRTLKENLTSTSLSALCNGMLRLLDLRQERSLAKRIADKFSVNHPGLEAPMTTLSGGNQQKAILGRWLHGDPHVCILDEPTKGVDIGARAAVHQLIVALAAKGVAFVLISSDVPELLGLAHCIMVLHKGRVAGTLERSQADASRILHMASTGRDL